MRIERFTHVLRNNVHALPIMVDPVGDPALVCCYWRIERFTHVPMQYRGYVASTFEAFLQRIASIGEDDIRCIEVVFFGTTLQP